MGAASGPEVVNNNMTLYFDMSNALKSWKGAPTTNLLYDSGVINWSIGNLVAAVSRATLIENDRYRITSTTGGDFRLYVPPAKLANNLSYNLSYKYNIISGTTFSMSDWCDTTLQNRVDIDYGTYRYSSAYGTRATYDGVYRFMDINISANTVVDIWDVQLEQRAFGTQFVNGTRSNTQALLDLTGQTAITANNLTYYANGSFSFNGTDNFIVAGRVKGTGTSTSSVSWCIWTRPKSLNGNIMSMSSESPQTSWNMPPIVADGGKFRGKIWNNTYLYSSDFTLNQWYYVCLVFSYENSSQRLYVNGELVAEQTGIGYSSSGVDNYLFFGQANPGADNKGNYAGDIASCQVYNRALSANEIAQNFVATRSQYGI